MIIQITDAPTIRLSKAELRSCDEFGSNMKGKSCAPQRDGQPANKIARDFAIGSQAEIAFWKTLPWTSTEGPDLNAYEDRSQCSFGADVGTWQVKSASPYQGETSYIFQNAHLRHNPTGWVAFMEACHGAYRLAYVLTYEDVIENAMPMKKPSLRGTKSAVYTNLLLADAHATIAELPTLTSLQRPHGTQLSA